MAVEEKKKNRTYLLILSLESFGSKKRLVRGCFESRYWRYLRLPLFLGHEEFVAALVDKTVVFEKYRYCLPRTLSCAFRISRQLGSVFQK